MASWLDDGISAVGGLFGGGDTPVPTNPNQAAGPSIWSAILPSLIQGTAGFIQGQGTGDIRKQELAQTLTEQQKNRDFQKELLLLRDSLGKGGGGGGGGPDPRVLRQNAINTGVSAALQGGQLTQTSLANLVANVQRGLAQVQSSKV